MKFLQICWLRDKNRSEHIEWYSLLCEKTPENPKTRICDETSDWYGSRKHRKIHTVRKFYFNIRMEVLNKMLIRCPSKPVAPELILLKWNSLKSKPINLAQKINATVCHIYSLLYILYKADETWFIETLTKFYIVLQSAKTNM